MNKKYALCFLAFTSLISFAAEENVPAECTTAKNWESQKPAMNSGQTFTNWQSELTRLQGLCTEATRQAGQRQANQNRDQELARNGLTDATQCQTIIDSNKEAKSATPGRPIPNRALVECLHLTSLAIGNGKFRTVQLVPSKPKKSMDGQINCDMTTSFTQDYEPCVRAINYYNAVMMAEQAMMLEQKIRTDLNNQKVAERAQRSAKEGDLQGAALDGASATASHEKAIQTEKMLAYSTGVAALVNAYRMIPGKDGVREKCQMRGELTPYDQGDFNQIKCEETIEKFEGQILQNQEAKAAIAMAITNFTAKGVAAGILMNKNGQKVAAINKVKQSYAGDVNDDMMVERCAYFPNDPECKKAGQRVSGQSVYSGGSVDLGGEGGNNAFNMNPDDSVFGEKGAEGAALDDKNEVAGINSPFKNDATLAKGIINPAAAASVTPTGGAGGGGGSGGGGVGGGGGASLGRDLAGANKEGDKEAQIKATKLSGNYNYGGGGGYRAISSKKEDTNPFSSLFEQKGSGEAADEDVSVGAGDIDGAASGLFQKISKRYSQMHSDKRIEANNLE